MGAHNLPAFVRLVPSTAGSKNPGLQQLRSARSTRAQPRGKTDTLNRRVPTKMSFETFPPSSRRGAEVVNSTQVFHPTTQRALSLTTAPEVTTTQRREARINTQAHSILVGDAADCWRELAPTPPLWQSARRQTAALNHTTPGSCRTFCRHGDHKIERMYLGHA